MQHGRTITGRLMRRLVGTGQRVGSCSVCGEPIRVDPHCIRIDDAFVHAHCALYRRRPVGAA